jgi:carbonic anhydrase/acetyltransferase-like protein (isoleucine patch superfamily)
MTIIKLGDFVPEISKGVFIAPGSQVMGKVKIGKGSGIWYGSILRGDVESIQIGEYTNIQDLTVIHTEDDCPTIMGNGITVGHQCCIHGATIGDFCLIGMGATILSGAEIGEGSIIGAGALVPEGKVIPPGVLVMGVPGKIKRDVTEEEKKGIREHAKRYAEYAKQHIKWLKENHAIS